MNISIVIPNWNGEEKLKQNLPEVLKVKNVDEVIVVDDCSTDKSAEFIKQNFPQVKLIEKKKNSGFSSTVNLGVKNASSDLVFLVNSDAVPEPDCLKYIFPHFEDKKVFSVGCFVGGSWSWGYFKNGFFWHYLSNEKMDKAHQTLWASGGSGVFRKDIWEKLGGFDELFDPFYEEDLDLGYRATKRGFINILEPKAKVEHYKQTGVIAENFSQSKIARTAQRNQLLFIWKNITDSSLIRKHVLSLMKMLLTKPGYWSVFFRAFLKLPQILKKRAVEIKEAKLEDKEIFAKYTQQPV